MNKQHLSFIDFFDSTNAYLDILSSSSDALKYYAGLTENNGLGAIANSISFAVYQLQKEFEKYQNVIIASNSDNGGSSDE